MHELVKFFWFYARFDSRLKANIPLVIAVCDEQWRCNGPRLLEIARAKVAW